LMFYIVGLCILFVWKKPQLRWLSWLVLLATIGASTAYSWHVTYVHGIGTFAPASHDLEMRYLYQTPWHRIPAFLVGMAFPWGIDMAKRRGFDRQSATHSRVAETIVTIASCLAVVVLTTLIILPVSNYPGGRASSRQGGNWPQFSNSLYICFSRLTWACAVGIITLACYYDYLPMTNAFLSHWAWKPMAKLTFGAYLLHPILIGVFFGNLSGFQLFSITGVLSSAWWYFCLAYAAAIVLYCVVEKPIASLRESFMAPSGTKKAVS